MKSTLRFVLTVSLLLLASVSSVSASGQDHVESGISSGISISNQQGASEHAVDAHSQRRELTGFWSLLFLLAPDPKRDGCNCPKGVLGDPCRHKKGLTSSECSSSSSSNNNNSGGNSNTNSNTNSNGNSNGNSNTNSDGSDYTTSSASSQEDGSGYNGYNGYNNDGSGGSSNTNSANSNNANDKAIPEGAAMINPNDFSFWMIVAAAVAAAFATGAVVMGQRKKRKDPHPLSGSVARRMGLFSNFADSALCNGANSAAGQRPARVVEMTMSKEDYSMA